MILWGTQWWYSKHLWCPLNTLNLSSSSMCMRSKKKKKEASINCRMNQINQCNAYFHLISGECL